MSAPSLPMPSVEEALRRSCERLEARAREALDGLDGPAVLTNAMRHAVLAGGKRIRPFVLLESANLFGVIGEIALETALALEYVHCYSLVHDDLPAMDDDVIRRGKPAVHVAFGEANAILAGDALLAEAFARLSDQTRIPPPEMRAELAAELSKAAGAGGIAGGQALDLSKGPESDFALIRKMKTAALFRFSGIAGAIIGGASAEDRAALANFGEELGLLFQAMDDFRDTDTSVSANETDTHAVLAKRHLHRFGEKGTVLAALVHHVHRIE